MKIPHFHPWNLSPREAIAVQERLRERVVSEDRLGELLTVAGLDVGLQPNRRRVRGAAAVLSFPRLEVIDWATAERPADFPYVPGLLSFREIPVLLEALGRLERAPDLLLCDGQGLAHPRRFGLACHLGVLLDIPSIGVAKSRFIGTHSQVPSPRGSSRRLNDGEEVIGAVLRTRAGVRPVYVSIGHRVSLETALRVVLETCPRFRLPEPLRLAHGLASADDSRQDAKTPGHSE